MHNGDGTTDWLLPSTIYAYDVAPESSGEYFSNRRVFAYIDTGLADGIKLDSSGNVYCGTGDGVQVSDFRTHTHLLNPPPP
jgi:sugar lactone lactonase YvrE